MTAISSGHGPSIVRVQKLSKSDDEGSEQGKRYSAKELYTLYGGGVVPVTCVNADGDQGIGTAFHVGDGAFVTARHVVEDKTSCHVEIDTYRLRHFGGPAVEDLASKHISPFKHFSPIKIDPLPHPDPSKDVAVFSIPDLAGLPAIPLGDHLDDWIIDYDFLLDEVLILGFPPIPLSQRNVLFATRAQINAVLDLINVEHVHFIASAMARGGFSGGVVLSEGGFALGVVTTSILKSDLPEELGYLAILTVEPILECLGIHRVLPLDLARQWDGLFTATVEHFGVPKKKWAHSWIEVDRDGSRARISFGTPDKRVQMKISEALKSVPGFNGETELIGTAKHVWEYQGDYAQSIGPLEQARVAICEVMLAEGYLPVDQPTVHSYTLDEPSISPDVAQEVDPQE